ncbi:MAG: phosphatase PAP2 family protein [Cytophagales bacterium]|nr:phosphatase PAP2 family protein [Cytophagales bacterium]MDW8383609.1 phosphatase PAP2 family protein [Flammeovirgaceae bacterium]
MLETLHQIDQELFLFLNQFHNQGLDVFMGIITDKKPWIPFYVLIIWFLFWKYNRNAISIIVAIAITITLCDQFASSFCKPFFGRLRPCYNEEIKHLIHLVGKCGGDFGFISSHAANTFGLATFLFLLLKKEYPSVRWMFAWAALVSYSRVYVGVHYPGDVIVGALSGVVWAIIVFYFYKLWIKKRQKSSLQPTN